MKQLTLFTLTIVFFITIPLFSQNDQSEKNQEGAPKTEVNHEMNHLAIFAGGTVMLEKKGTYFTLGLDYVHILIESREWAAGGFAEIIFAEHSEWVFGALIYARIYDKLFIRTGPGVEILKHEESNPDGNFVHVNTQTEFLYRIGIGYNYHTKGLIIAPTIDFDFVRHASALVFGVNIGIPF